MRALVISDLHANADALRAVFSRVRRKRLDAVVCLGDFVGYNAEPNQVLDVMRAVKQRKLYIRGNHDRVVAGLEEGTAFNPAAHEVAHWTREHLSAPNRRFLQSLPTGPLRHDGVLLCHGSPDDEDEYVFHDLQALRVFERTDAPIVLYGHTHLPVIFSIDANGSVAGCAVRDDASFRLERGRRYLINPGSVGQPRDRNPHASFAIVDSGRMTAQFFRVSYDVGKTQRAIVRAGLPVMLANRLKFGT
ncbi:MAG TPA: metallophosphoesterase family protein [Thermoanaerobaculia bacterium]|nr:metallophosphoesterase family protein [Thermoanaerobaculia bacterium]